MTELLAQEGTQQGSPFSFLIFLVPLALLFFMMRSQKRKAAVQQQRQQAAGVGDEIMTTGGIFGTIVNEDEDEGTVTVEIAPGTRIRMLRSGIARTMSDEDEVLEDDEDDDASGDAARS